MINRVDYYSQKRHNDWVHGKCSDRIEQGRYFPIIAFSERKIRGMVLYDVQDVNTEIKFLRIDPNYRNWDLGYFLLRQAEVESGALRVTLGVSVRNFSGVSFFILNGFKPQGVENLYGTGLEYLMEKQIS